MHVTFLLPCMRWRWRCVIGGFYVLCTNVYGQYTSTAFVFLIFFYSPLLQKGQNRFRMVGRISQAYMLACIFYVRGWYNATLIAQWATSIELCRVLNSQRLYMHNGDYILRSQKLNIYSAGRTLLGPYKQLGRYIQPYSCVFITRKRPSIGCKAVEDGYSFQCQLLFLYYIQQEKGSIYCQQVKIKITHTCACET